MTGNDASDPAGYVFGAHERRLARGALRTAFLSLPKVPSIADQKQAGRELLDRLRPPIGSDGLPGDVGPITLSEEEVQLVSEATLRTLDGVSDNAFHPRLGVDRPEFQSFYEWLQEILRPDDPDVA